MQKVDPKGVRTKAGREAGKDSRLNGSPSKRYLHLELVHVILFRKMSFADIRNPKLRISI